MEDVEVLYEATEEDEIAAIDFELRQIQGEIEKLKERKLALSQRKQKLQDDALLKKSLTVSKKDWERDDFPWSKDLLDALTKVFRIKRFRELQKAAINAILSKEDTILVMPTGGGKSLCYQLPAVIGKGVTIVISPLLALMEDQLHGLEKINVKAGMMNPKSDKTVTKSIMDALEGKDDGLKLVYITPEYMKKSKRFMAKLQKAFNMKLLELFAIDEIHCCSTWGHDFRPDYQFLGCLKDMFPGVPILGLTATAPAKIINDVQKMLDIQGCLVLRASFNRPNLFYEVRRKPADKEVCLSMLANLLKTRFADMSGIIYTTTIKDAEQLTSDLRDKGLKLGCYHAMLEPEVRSKIYQRWITGEYQAVVATIAFGLGIDKPDVRFVIHHCVSKSMENFYQESGRAGRDGKKAACIVLYRLADIFRLSTMVIGDKVGLQNLYKVLEYCLEPGTCRRSLIAKHFEENWRQEDCAEMCDHCRRPKKSKETDIGSHCRQLYQIIEKALKGETNLTLIKLMDAWFNKGAVAYRVSSIPVPKFSREAGEAIVGHLLVNGYLKEDFVFNAYANLTYLNRGPKSGLAMDKNHRIMFCHDQALDL
ncbi:ATP-dependent DNA helicase Q1 [Diachasma alloeum]|uniref:ATP-dependent DNA helicase n=1 Tax=Diachasma alloeum TaxID=454923 RepID=A0A4E0S0Y9_9HYME|nr:ATP-dependent DNA helicase Q1 [Diachasma alloeum]THK32960.1 DNA helicase RecQ1 [Diachasma alloeum]